MSITRMVIRGKSRGIRGARKLVQQERILDKDPRVFRGNRSESASRMGKRWERAEEGERLREKEKD